MKKCIIFLAIVVLAVTLAIPVLGAEQQQPQFQKVPQMTPPTTTYKVPPFASLSATVIADPASQTGNCPLTATFKGKITLSGISPLTKPLEVKYRLKFTAPGTDSLVYTMTFTKLDAQAFSHTFPGFGNSGLPAYSGSVWVEIISPTKVESKRSPFSFKCSNM
jgi:hypothetical protein